MLPAHPNTSPMSFTGNIGYCSVCASQSTFIVKGEWLRDQYVCAKCGSIPRQRALTKLLRDIRPNWKSETLHESSPTLRLYAEQCRGYSYSFFFDDVALGSFRDGHRCENLEALTFSDGSFDIFITQDVLEHVFHPDRALAEIMRVVREGGIHIFTAPKHKTLLKSRPRVQEVDGRTEYLLPPEYHANPISGLGSLVTWDYGADFDDLIQQWSGYNTCNFIIRDRRLGIDGEFLDVFVTTKHRINRLS